MSDHQEPPKRVLVIDDDASMRRLITDYLHSYSFQTMGASSWKEIVLHIIREEPDLIILELCLAEENGLELLCELRSLIDIPVITTGRDCGEDDLIMGLELGADDHVSKPFGMRELLARIRAVLRRHRGAINRGRLVSSGVIYKFGRWRLDVKMRCLTDTHGKRITLSRSQCRLLMAFLKSPQRILSRLHLQQVNRRHDDIKDRSIDVQILRLRRKIEPTTAVSPLIRSERGLGYVFTLPVEIESGLMISRSGKY